MEESSICNFTPVEGTLIQTQPEYSWVNITTRTDVNVEKLNKRCINLEEANLYLSQALCTLTQELRKLQEQVTVLQSSQNI